MDDQKQWLAGVFDRAAPTYDAIGAAYHRHFARRLVDLAGIVPGSDVLDVACGPFDRAEDIVGLLTGAGFDDVRVHHEDLTVMFASEQDWWDWHWSFSLRGVLEQFDRAALESLRTASYEQMAALRTADGFPLQLNAWVVTGRVSRGRRTASPPPSP